MPLDILRNQKDLLIRRAVARSYVKSTISTCPICEKRKQIAKTMSEIKKQFHPNEK